MQVASQVLPGGLRSTHFCEKLNFTCGQINQEAALAAKLNWFPVWAPQSHWFHD